MTEGVGTVDIRDLVRAYYPSAGVADAVVDVLARSGIDIDHLTVHDLAAVDQLHAGGAAATALVLERIGLAAGMTLLDVGCGLGGPSRMAANTYQAQVIGVDLTPELVVAANDLAARVGLEGSCRFLATSGETLPFEEHSFDAAMMIHVGMNIRDKQSVFAEVHRVLSPGSVFALYEQVRRRAGQLAYPLPWAVDERSSFVETADEYVAALTAAGFRQIEVEDRTGPVPGAPPSSGKIGPADILGPAYVEGVSNHIAATKAGLLGGLLVLARA
ncbi:MAG: arsenite methyltransferase [Actinomycetota bacterium]|nr:arsenite methyltransferase [Actinomycetota bacterium]